MKQTISFEESNAAISYATHGMFRYFGKLPAPVLRHVITEASKLSGRKPGPFIDLMVGSGTSLVEAMLLGVPSVGVDVNPLSVMISRAKTTILPEDVLWSELERIMSCCPHEHGLGQLGLFTPPAHPNGAKLGVGETPRIRNLDYWFLPVAQEGLRVLHAAINEIVETDEVRNFFLVVFASCIRRCSNASPRVGRIFHIDHERVPDVFKIFYERASAAIRGLRQLGELAESSSVRVHHGDAKSPPLPDEFAPIVHFHPPYFALYRYSSDVLRFEMSWLNMDRTGTAAREIRDGFKTTNRADYEDYMDDLDAVMRSALRCLVSGGILSVVVNNSTFRDEELPVVSDLVIRAELAGFEDIKIQRRRVLYQQASYHRSARVDKRTDSDYLIFARRP